MEEGGVDGRKRGGWKREGWMEERRVNGRGRGGWKKEG